MHSFQRLRIPDGCIVIYLKFFLLTFFVGVYSWLSLSHLSIDIYIHLSIDSYDRNVFSCYILRCVIHLSGTISCCEIIFILSNVDENLALSVVTYLFYFVTIRWYINNLFENLIINLVVSRSLRTVQGHNPQLYNI